MLYICWTYLRFSQFYCEAMPWAQKLILILQKLELGCSSQQQRGQVQVFADPKSLYLSFKNIISEHQHFQIGDLCYLDILKELMRDNQLFQLKGAEFFEAWMIYHLKVAFNFGVTIEEMLKIIKKTCDRGNIALKLCVQEITKKNFPQIESCQNCKKQNKELILNFIQNCQSQMKQFDLKDKIIKKQQSKIEPKDYPKKVKKAQASIRNITLLEPFFLQDKQKLQKQLGIIFNDMNVDYSSLSNLSKKFQQNPRILKHIISKLTIVYQRRQERINIHSSQAISIQNILRLCELFLKLSCKNLERAELMFVSYHQAQRIDQMIAQLQSQFHQTKKQIQWLVCILIQTKSNQKQKNVSKEQIQKSQLKLRQSIPHLVKQSFAKIDKYNKNTHEYLKMVNILKVLIKNSAQKYKETFYSNKPQSVFALKQSLQYLQTLSQCQALKIECKSALTIIFDSIKWYLQEQILKTQQLALLIANDEEFSSKVANLEGALLKIQIYSQLNTVAGLKYANRLKEAKKTLSDRIRSFYFGLKNRIAKAEFSIRNQLGFDEITNLKSIISELKYLKCHKKILSFVGLQSFLSQLQKTCTQKLLQPYYEINKCILSSGMTEKLLNELNLFIEYDLHLSRMMSEEDYEKNIAKVKRQNYDNRVALLMQKLRSQMINSLNKLKEDKNSIYDIANLRSFKGVYSLFSCALKDGKILKLMNSLNLYKQFKELYDNITKFLQQSQAKVLKQFKQAQNGKTTEIFLEKIRKCCFEMKQFDSVLEQQNNFSEINKMADQEFYKIRLVLSNKLIQIFTQSNIDYKRLREFIPSNRANPSIFPWIRAKIMKQDQSYCEQIKMKKQSEDLLFEDQNLNYIKLLQRAYIFYSETTIIIWENGEIITLKLSLQYLRSFINPFVLQYQHFYQKIMQDIYRLNCKTIPEKIQLFFSNLEQLTLKLMPIDYKTIKDTIFKIPLHPDFEIQNYSSQKQSITHRICRINRVLIDGMAKDFTKVLNIFKQSSKKYYDYLSLEQKERYLQKLRQYFKQIIGKYKQQVNDGKDDCEKPVLNFFTLIPDQKTKQQLSNQFQTIKNQLANIKKQIYDNFSCGLKKSNLNEIVKYFKQMNSKDRTKNKSRLKTFIEHEFQSIFDQSIVNKAKLLQQYKQLCSKYEKQKDAIKQLSGEYSNIKIQTKDRILSIIIKSGHQNIDIKNASGELSNNPNNTVKDQLSLKKYIENKKMTIMELIYDNVRQALYHIKQFKTLIQIVSNIGFKKIYQNVVKEISEKNTFFFTRFKLLVDQILENQSETQTIQQIKNIYDKLKSSNLLNCFHGIKVYQESNLSNLIKTLLDNLELKYKSYSFGNIHQSEFKKTIKIINFFSQHFNKTILHNLQNYIIKKYQQANKEIKRLISQNQFNIKFKSLYEQYSNICMYYQLVNEKNKSQRPEQMLTSRYSSIKKQVQPSLLMLSQYCNKFEKNHKKQFTNNILKLQKNYHTLQSIMSLEIMAKITQQNIKKKIFGTFELIIKQSQSKSIQIINQKEKTPQKIETLKNILQFLQQIIAFKQFQQQCQIIKDYILSSIKRDYDLQICRLEKIIHNLIKNKQMHSNFINLDSILFKIRNYQFTDNSHQQKSQHIEKIFFHQFFFFFGNQKQKIQRMKISLEKNIKIAQVTNLINNIKGLQYLKKIQQQSIKTLIDQILDLQKKYIQRLILPYKQIQKYLPSNGFLTVKITKNLLNRIETFAQYDAHIAQMMTNKNYEQIISKIKLEHYENRIQQFFKYFYQTIENFISIIDFQKNLFDNFTIETLKEYKKQINLLIYALKSDCVLSQMSRLNYKDKFKFLEGKVIKMLNKSSQFLLKQFHSSVNKINFQTIFQNIRKYCLVMKEFDNEYDSQNIFSQIIKMIDNQYSKKQPQMTNKLIYIFTESSVDYKQLNQFYLKNPKKFEIVYEIKNKIREHDQLLCHKIHGMKKYEEDLLFQNQNLNYVRLIKEAYKFYCQIKEFTSNARLKISLKINNEYLKQSLNPFVSRYQHIYQKIMENICKLNYKTLPKKIQSFLTILQQLFIALLPKQYELIKKNIQSIQFNADFKNKWKERFIDKNITYRICQFNRALNESLQDDLQKVFDIFQPSSTKYYKYLKQKQKQKYLKSLKSYFQEKIQLYQKNSKEGTKQQLELRQFLKFVPEQAQQQFQNQYIKIKMKIQSQKNINQQLSKAPEKKFEQIVQIYQKMDKQVQRECVNRLIRIMLNDFQYKINGQISKKQIISQYARLCNKYKISLTIQAFQIRLQTKKRQLQSSIIKMFGSLIQQNENILQKIDSDMIDQLRQNNRIIVEAYIQCIDKKLEAFSSLLERIQKYFIGICQKHEKQVVVNPNFLQWKRKDLQQYIKLQYFLTRTIQPIVKELLYNKRKIISYRRSQKILEILKEKNIYQRLQKISGQLIKIYQQINTFSLTNFINQMKQNPNIEILIKNHIQNINQKLNLLQDISPIYNKCELNKLRIKRIANINDFSLFKGNITKQLNLLFSQIQKLQDHPERSLSNRFLYISNLFQLSSNSIKQILLKPLNNIKKDFSQKIQVIISGFQIQIQSFNDNIEDNKKSKIAGNQDKIIQKIMDLIVMQKMQGIIILFYKQFFRQRATNLEKRIANNEQLLLKIIQQEIKKKITLLPEINILAKKHRLFRCKLKAQFPFQSTLQNQVFLKQFYSKNKNKNLQMDYESFEKNYQRTLYKYYQNDFDIAIQQISKCIYNQIGKISKLQTIGKIFGLYSILKRIPLKPHIAQIVAISLLLNNIQNNQEIKNNVLEMLPGEGKSMVLAGVACYLALKGFNVYQICYTQYLANRDFQEFTDLLSALKIQNRIKYGSLNQFCKSVVLPCSLEQLIKNELVQQTNQQKGGNRLQELFSTLRSNLSEQNPRNVILIDQVDILFSSKYEGKCFEPTIQISDDPDSSQIKDILEYIYMQSKNSYLTESKLKNQSVYTKLLKKYSSIKNLLKSHVVMMLNDVLDKRQISILFQKIKINSEIQKKNIQTEHFFTGYHEAFAYIRLKQQSKISEKTMKNKLKIHIRIGQFSYGEVVKKFGKILGVSGSLDCLSKYDKDLLNEYYQIRNIYFIPSIFKKKQINYQCEIIDSQSKPDFDQQIVKKMQNQFENQMSMIILFETKEGIEKFYPVFSDSIIFRNSKVNNLKINLIFDQINYSNMSMITSPNTLTLATKDIFRGIDYKDIHLTKGLYVIQTYIPENIYDLGQAKKRTARGEKPGAFKLIIWKKQLQPKEIEGISSIKWNQQFFQKILFEQQQKSRNSLKFSKSISKHNKTLQIFNGKRLTLFLNQMNQAKIKEIEGQFLILFCFQGNLNNLQDYKQWLIIMLQQYQNYLKKNTEKIKLKYQVCYYGSYMNFNLGFQNIFKASKICQLTDLKAELKSMKGFKLNKSKQGMSIELFFNHLTKLNKKYEIKTCFIWSAEREYRWAQFKNTSQFKRYKQKIKKQLDFQQGIKTCNQCFKTIKYAGIYINLIGLLRQPAFQKQIQELSLNYEKQLFTFFQPLSLDKMNLKIFFFERMKKAIPYFEELMIYL